jgi:hypothetical protein
MSTKEENKDVVLVFNLTEEPSNGCKYLKANIYVRKLNDRDDITSIYDWRKDLSITAQADDDKDLGDVQRNHFYGVRLTANVNVFDENSTKGVSKLRARISKYLDNNPQPKTLGDYAFMVGKALDISRAVVFRDVRQSWHDKPFYITDLKAAGADFDSMAKRKFPHLVGTQTPASY